MSFNPTLCEALSTLAARLPERDSTTCLEAITAFLEASHERDALRAYAEGLQNDMARILDLCYGKPTFDSDREVLNAVAAIADDARVKSPGADSRHQSCTKPEGER